MTTLLKVCYAAAFIIFINAGAASAQYTLDDSKKLAQIDISALNEFITELKKPVTNIYFKDLYDSTFVKELITLKGFLESPLQFQLEYFNRNKKFYIVTVETVRRINEIKNRINNFLNKGFAEVITELKQQYNAAELESIKLETEKNILAVLQNNSNSIIDISQAAKYIVIKPGINYVDSLTVILGNSKRIVIDTIKTQRGRRKPDQNIETIHLKLVDYFIASSGGLDSYEVRESILNNSLLQVNGDKDKYKSAIADLELMKGKSGKFKSLSITGNKEVLINYSTLSDHKNNLETGALALNSGTLKMSAEATIINAIGNYVVEQVKEYLVTDFFEKLNEHLSKVEYLFPNTFLYLRKLKEGDRLQYSITQALKENIKTDLSEMTDNLLSENHGANPVLNFLKGKNLDQQLIIVNDFVKLSKSGFQPVDLLNYLEMKLANNGSADNNLVMTVSMLNALQQTLRVSNIGTQQPQNLWLSYGNLVNLNEQKEVEIFFSCLLSKIRDTQFSQKLCDFFSDKKYTDLIDLKNGFTESAITLNKIQNILSAVNKQTPDLSTERICDYYDFVYEIIENTDNFRIRFLNNDKSNSLPWIKAVIKNQKELIRGNYLSALNTLIQVGGAVIIPELKADSTLETQLNFLVDVAVARNSEDITQAINKAVNRFGGYKRKNTEGTHYSLNTYAGLFLGREELQNGNAKFNGGFMVPLGFEISSKYFGILFNVLDFGTVVSFRMESDEPLPTNINFQQLLAPGIFLKYRFTSGSPITLLGGIEYTPKLRVNYSGSVQEKVNSMRYGFGIAYDIPLFYLN